MRGGWNLPHAARPSGIDTDNLTALFEEHMVLAHLDPANPINNSFGLREKVGALGLCCCAPRVAG